MNDPDDQAPDLDLDPIEGLIDVVGQLSTSVQSLRARVAALESGPDRSARPGDEPEGSEETEGDGAPASWADTADPQDWVDLAGWVDWLLRVYVVPDAPLMPCWPHHPGVVEELAALRMSWMAARLEVEAGPSSVMEAWHDRSLHPTLTRVSNKGGRFPIRSCTPSKHVPEQPPYLTDRSALPTK